MAAETFDEAADALYALAPSEFVAARRSAVDRARRAGDRGLADRLGDLRRPTVSAYALNLFARARPEQLARLRLRELAAERNMLVTALAKEARELAVRAGQTVGGQAVGDIEQTLRAALADEHAAEQLARGRLTRALMPGSVLPELPAPPVGHVPEPSGRQVRPPSPPRAALRERRAEARKALRDLEQEQRTAAAAAGRLRTRADRAAEQRTAAGERVRSAEEDLVRAREALAAAEERRTAADAEAAAAEQRSQEARRRRDEQRAAVDRLGQG
ncbi:hypothetical protein [Streptacidiphilus rugosus]|uniref:hypothetical protein n=1 Tax=Streptacidiphilus rugosus TaxID=405783 RepID=UPI0006898D34|nr:hypothetical protein [Streptacidiphilus rugosus]